MNELPKFCVGYSNDNRIFVIHMHDPRWIAEVFMNGNYMGSHVQLRRVPDPAASARLLAEEVETQLLDQATAFYKNWYQANVRQAKRPTTTEKNVL